VSKTREQLERAPYAYFEAVDRKDMDATLAFFADDATFTVQSAHIVFAGKSEIRGMFETFFADYATIVHGVTNVVVDERRQKVSTEQTCPHIRDDGTPETVTTCNFFTVGDDGRFTRVIIWIDGVSPLK
jgi:ketosteroid isomerase-like protein